MSESKRKAKTEKSDIRVVVRSSKSDDLPASRSMLKLVRNELKSDIKAVDRKVDALDAKVDAMDARFKAIDARFDAMDAKFDALETKFDTRFNHFSDRIDSRLSRMELLIEEQRSDNRIVLEAIVGMNQRLTRVEEIVLK